MMTNQDYGAFGMDPGSNAAGVVGISGGGVGTTSA